jgi:hypothetical protein
LCGGIEIAVEAAVEILLVGKIGAVADPDGECVRAEPLADFDTLDVMVYGLLTRSV